MTIRVLNLYAGIGGNRKLWTNVDVTAVEIDPKIAAIYQKFFPDDKVIVADAHQYLLDHFKEFDFIWSSPPCQTHTDCNYFLHAQGIIRYPDMSLWQEIIFLRYFCKVPYVVENVEPYYRLLLYEQGQICGRHCFWSNFYIPNKRLDYEIGTFNRSASKLKQTKIKKTQIERNCVEPELGLHVFKCAFKVKQKTLGEIS